MGSFEALRLPCLEASHPLARYPMRRRRSVHGLRGPMTLFRRHLTPLLAQLLPPFRRHLAEPVEGIAHFALPLRR